MNLSVSNSEHKFENRNGSLAVNGNSNKIWLKNCRLQVNMAGNGN